MLAVDAFDDRLDALSSRREEHELVADVAFALSNDGVSTRQGRERGRRALDPLEVVGAADRRRVDAADVHLAAVGELSPVAADRGREQHARGRAGGLAGAERDGVPAALRGDHVARAELLLERALVARQQRLAEDGDERHECQADHQCGSGRGRAARVAHRVLLGEAAGHAAEACCRQADDMGQRANEPRRDRCEPDEDPERAEADPEHPHRRRDALAERAVDEAEHRECSDDEAEDQRLPRRPLDDHPAFAHGRDRSDPRGADAPARWRRRA